MCIAVVETEWIRGVRYLQHSMLERREPWKQFLCALQRFAAEISTANSGVEIVLKGSRISYPRLRAGIPTIEESGGYAIQSAEIQGCRCSSQPLLNFNSRFDANAPVRSCRCWHRSNRCTRRSSDILLQILVEIGWRGHGVCCPSEFHSYWISTRVEREDEK